MNFPILSQSRCRKIDHAISCCSFKLFGGYAGKLRPGLRSSPWNDKSSYEWWEKNVFALFRANFPQRFRFRAEPRFSSVDVGETFRRKGSIGCKRKGHAAEQYVSQYYLTTNGCWMANSISERAYKRTRRKQEIWATSFPQSTHWTKPCCRRKPASEWWGGKWGTRVELFFLPLPRLDSVLYFFVVSSFRKMAMVLSTSNFSDLPVW